MACRIFYFQHVDFLVAACDLLVAACMWDRVPQPGSEPRPPALGAQTCTHWTTREVPTYKVLTASDWLSKLWRKFHMIVHHTEDYSALQRNEALTHTLTWVSLKTSLQDLVPHRELPGGPVVRTRCFHCGGRGSKILKASRPKKIIFSTSKNFWSKDFPGGAVVKTLCFQCKGPEFNPWSGN